SVWPFAIVPVVVTLVITGGLASLAIGVLPAKITAWIGATSVLGTIGVWILKVVSVVLSVAAAALLGFAFAQPLSGVALHRIAGAVEAKLGAPAWPKTGFLDDVKKSLQSVGVAYLFGLPILAVLFLVNFAFPPASVVTVPLKLVVVALLIAWDL